MATIEKKQRKVKKAGTGVEAGREPAAGAEAGREPAAGAEARAGREAGRGPGAADRRTELLDAGLRVIARDGMRGLTHRSVENEADVPHGSTTYHFGTRNDLLAALAEHMKLSDREKVEPIAHQLTLLLVDRSQEFDLSTLAGAVVAWVESNPELQLARYEMQLAGAREPHLKQLMTDCSVTFRRLIEPIVVAAGSKQPERHARMVQAMVDGLVLDWLTHTDGDTTIVAEGIERVLATFGVAADGG